VDDLDRFTQSLREDLAAWLAATQHPPLNKHASQVAGIAGQLTGALDDLKDAPAGRAGEREQEVGDYLHIWDFFRSMLALRFVPWYQPLLGAADDLAWAAFQPVRDAVADKAARDAEAGQPARGTLADQPARDAPAGGLNREPPLVYFSRDVIPFTVTRGQAYEGLLPRGGLWTDRSEAIANHLIVPVVSLPWQRFSALPVLLSVAHEVGHVVAADLALEPTLRERLAAANVAPGHRAAWEAWLEEVFADVFSAVVCGSSVALSLAGHLDTRQPVAGDQDPPQGEPPHWGQYPPPALRAELIRHVARRRGGSGPPHAGEDGLGGFRADLELIAAALLDDAYPQLTARPEDLYPPVDGEALELEIDRLTRGRDLETGDIRVVLAAATAADEESPDEDARQGVAVRALARAGQIRDETRRGADDKEALDRGRQAGPALAELLRAAHGPVRDDQLLRGA
jgi:hypothetical protein